MMNKSELWNEYIRQNPHWKNENVTLTPLGLKKLVFTTFEQGVQHGKDITPTDFLSEIFGAKK